MSGVHAALADGGDRVSRDRRSAFGAVLVAAASATQDIVVDAFRVESLPEREQAAGMAGYVAAYRIGMLISTAGALFLVSYFETGLGLGKSAACMWGYLAMGAGADRHRRGALGHRAGKLRRRGRGA